MSCSSGKSNYHPDDEYVSAVRKRYVPSAPWEVWSRDAYGDGLLQKAERFVRDANFQEAINTYAEAERISSLSLVRDESMLRRFGTLLKLGQFSEVLTGVSEYVSKSGITVEQLDPRVNLVVAFAYYRANDLDQTMAWLSLAHRIPKGKGVAAQRAHMVAKRIVGSVPQAEFSSLSKTWSSDVLLGSLFRAERLRRSTGGVLREEISKKYFEISYYTSLVNIEDDSLVAVLDKDELFDSELFDNKPDGDAETMGVAASSGIAIVGVLLPLSGNYSDHAKRVRLGIELALDQFRGGNTGNTIKIEFGDTKGDTSQAAIEYARLVKLGAKVVLGPMLVKTTKQVAEESRQYGVPFVTFTKRQGIPELGNSVFRLGATANNQVVELVRYATEVLGVKTFGLVYPDTSAGREFALVFNNEAERSGGFVSRLIDYQSREELSFDYAASEIAAIAPQAVFMPDSLERVWDLLEKLREAEVPQPIMLGPALWDDPVAIRGYGAALNGAVYVTPFFANSEQPVVSEFRSVFESKYQSQPGLLSAQAYDAALMVFQAVVSTDGLPISIGESLRAGNGIRGVTGKLSVNSAGEISRRMSVLRLKNGESIEVMSAGKIVDVASEFDTIFDTMGQTNDGAPL